MFEKRGLTLKNSYDKYKKLLRKTSDTRKDVKAKLPYAERASRIFSAICANSSSVGRGSNGFVINRFS